MTNTDGFYMLRVLVYQAPAVMPSQMNQGKPVVALHPTLVLPHISIEVQLHGACAHVLTSHGPVPATWAQGHQYTAVLM
eukprot:m.882249 g.882249  ORF g.882249 m.882249 type:complete len:79 (-) comp23597_c0_seq19:1085-1321(-)